MKIYKFRNCWLNPAERQVLKDGKYLDLNTKTFDVLQLLIEEHGAIVTKDEILEKVWNGSFVEEGNLAVHISKLRHFLDETKNQPFIETVQGSGYRFVAPVHKASQDDWEKFQFNINHSSLNGVSDEWSFDSIAVLPFEIENKNAEIEYLADSLTESFLNGLSRLSNLKVITRNTAYKYKNKNADAREVGEMLGVVTVLTGRIRIIENHLAIGIELTKTKDGTQIWGKHFNRSFTDVFEIEESIIFEVLGKLQSKTNLKLFTKLSEAQNAQEKGQYEKAFQRLSSFWNGQEQFPIAIGLSKEESAELFLRFGGIIGYLGNNQKISNSQEISKNLLTNARQRFISFSNIAKIAECENYLALAYSRTGEFTEAFDWINESLNQKLPENHPVRINSFVIETLLGIDSGKYTFVLSRCEELKDFFEKYVADLENGCFHNHFAIAHKNLGNSEDALRHLESARNFFQKANHEIYYGAAENNLAQLLQTFGFYKKAHYCAEKAGKIFAEIGDKMREGYALETRAQICSAEGSFTDALRYVNSAIELLEGGESYRKLVESYRTKVKILLSLNQLSEALIVMTAAHNLAALYISQELSREIIESVADLIQAKYENS